MLWLAMAFVALMVFVSSNAFGDAALGDQIPLSGSIGFALWVGFIAMFFGGLAFALAPLLGRAGSAAVAGVAMMALWVASGLGVGGPLVALSPFHWTVNHVPLVGFYDWTGLAAVGVVAVVFLAIGVDLFRRRDLGVTAGLSLPSLPKDVLGVRGPVARAFGDQLPRALAWGLGLGAMGALLASLVGSFVEPDRERLEPGQDVLDDLPGLRLRDRRRLAPAVRRALLHRRRLRRRDVRLEVGVGRDGWPARGGPRGARCRAPAGFLRAGSRRSSRSS